MNAELFTDEPAPQVNDDLFTDEPAPTHSLAGFGKNLVQDIQGTVKGAGQLIQGLATHPVDTVSKIPGAVVNEAKRIGVPEMAVGVTKTLLDPFNFTGGGSIGTEQTNAAKKFGEAFYEKPLTTGLDVLPLAGAAGKALGIGEKATGVGLAPEATQAGEAGAAAQAGGVAEELGRVPGTPPPPINLPPEAADILKASPKGAPEATAAGAEATVPTGQTFTETVQNLTNKIPGAVKKPLEQVNEYIQGKYGPKWNQIVADYMKEHGQNMDLKELGAAPGQVRKIGIERARQLADYASENGLVGKTGTIGRERMIPQRLEEAGGAVGAFRKMAADRGAVVNPDELINQIRSQLDDKYLTAGLHSGEKGTYMKALIELKKAGGRADDLAGKITELFQEAKGLDRLKRPSGPVSDVARMARDLNHQMIASKLSPPEMAMYEHGLEDYGALTQINEFVKRRGSTEAGGRLGPGSGITRAAVQKFLDSMGYRAQAKIMRYLAEKIRANPEIASRPQNIFRNYVDEAAEAIDEMTGGGEQ